MDLTTRDKSLIIASMTFYMKHLEKYEEDDLPEDEFSEIQDEIVFLDKLIDEFKSDLERIKKSGPTGAQLHDLNSGQGDK